MSARLANWLPPGYVVRLPSEAEWAAAAAWSAAGKRQTYPWGEVVPTPERAVYQRMEERDGEQQTVNLGRPAPVGVLPLGAAACGALDSGRNG